MFSNLNDEAQLVRNQVLSICDLKQNGDIPPCKVCSRSTTIGNRMYMMGGADEQNIYGDLHVLEIEQMKWSMIQSVGEVPVGRFGHSLHSISPNQLILFGGFVNDASEPPVTAPFASLTYAGRITNEVFVFNTHSNEWKKMETKGDGPPGLAFQASCVMPASNQFIVHGGFVDTSFKSASGDMFALDLGEFTWKKVIVNGKVPSARACHGLAVQNKSLFLFGDDMMDDNRLYEISLESGECKQVDVLGTCPNPRRFLTLEFVGSRLYCFGGETPLQGSTDVYVLNVSSSSADSDLKWSKPLYEGSLSLRCQAGCVLNDKLMIFGGLREKVSNSVMGESELMIAKKLFFLNVLEIKESSSSADDGSSSHSQFKFKVVTVGDSGVGKSCLLTRFVSDVYSDFHVSTIGVDFKTVVTMVKGRLVKLLLWDTAGQERFSLVTGNYYRNADAFVIVYDATNRNSFEHVDQWIGQIKQHHECGPDTVKIIIGNKHDLAREVVVSETEARAKADSLGALFVAASAKTSNNVDLAFLTCAQDLVEKRRMQQQKAASSTPAPGLLNLASRSPSRAGPASGQNCCS